jgi:hypothetical protein
MNVRKLFLALVVAVGCVALAGLPAWAADSARPSNKQSLRIASIQVGSKAGPLVVRVRANVHTELSIWANGRRVKHPFELATRRAQLIELRASDGLRPGANRLRVRGVNGGRATTAKRTVRLSRRALLADAGADAGVFLRRHARVGTPPAGAGMDHRWRIVKRPQGAKATLRASDLPQPLLRAKHPGTYVLQLEADPDGPGPSAFDQVTVSVSPSDPPIGAPINTIDSGKGGAITIAGQSYGGGNGSSYVVLERTTRSPAVGADGAQVAGSVENNADGIAKLAGIADKYGADPNSPNYMKYLMIVSGRSGMPGGQADAFAGFVRSVGVAHLTQEDFSSLGQGKEFSLIGIPGAPEGAGTVRIPGVFPSWSITGAITGYLQRNQAIDANGVHLYDFASSFRPSFDTRSQFSADTNTMTVEGNRFPGNLPPGATAGLHVLVFESLTRTLLKNVALKTNGNESDRAWQKEAAMALNEAISQPGGPVVFIQTIGKPKAAGPEWDGIVGQLTRLGANRQLVYALDGTTEYSLVSRLGSEAPPAEASTAYDHGSYPAPSLPPARLIGVLERTRTSTLEPGVSGTPTPSTPDGAVNLDLIKIAYQDSQDWPLLAPKAKPGEAAAAENYICKLLNFCQAANSCPTLRDCYWQKYGSAWDEKARDLGNLKFPRDQTAYSETTFEAVQQQLLKEASAVAGVQRYLTQLQAPFGESGTGSYIKLQKISQDIWSAMQRPAADNTTSWALGLVGKIIQIGTFAGPPASAGAAGLAATFGLASYLSNKQGQAIFGSEVKAEASKLGIEILDRISTVKKATTGLGMLIVSDSGKLMATRPHLDSDWSLPEPAQALETVETSSEQWFYEALLPAAYPYLIRANGADNARNIDCRMYERRAWPNQPDAYQMQATTGYDESGRPIKSIFFFTQGIGGGSSPPASIGDYMFRPRGGPNPGLGLEKLSFFAPRLFGDTIIHAANSTPSCQLGWLPPKY